MGRRAAGLHGVHQLVLVVVLALIVAACDWTSFGFDAANTRATPDPAPNATAVGGLAHVWSGPTASPVAASPIVVDDTVFITTTSGKLEAFGPLDASDVTLCNWVTVCTPRWTAQLAGTSTSTPTVAGGVVYAASDHGTLQTFDAHGQLGCSGSPITCAAQWTTTGVGAITSSPLVSANSVYVGSADGNLYAYDARGVTNCVNRVCSPLWRGAVGGAITSSPAVAGGVVYVGSADGRLWAFDAAGSRNCTGSVCNALWSAPTGGAVRSSPAIAAGIAYVGSDSGSLSAYDAAGVTGCSGTPKTCAPLWSAPTGGPIVGAPAVADGRVMIGSDNANLTAYDAAGIVGCAGAPRICQPTWTAPMGSAVRGSPAVASHVVYAGSVGGQLAAFDVAGSRNCTGVPLVCSPLWSGSVAGAVSAPAISHGRVFVGSGNGLHVYRLVVTPTPTGVVTQSLTAEHDDVYGLSLNTGGKVTTTAAATNTGGNTRIGFTRPADGVATDAQSCATWSSDSSWRNQEGAALRVHAVPGGTQAITITKNIYFAANWFFNVHVWDTSQLPVAVQIGAFDLSSVFYPNQQLLPLPWRMCARTVDSTVSFIAWPAGESQPAWDDATHGGSVTLPTGFGGAGAAGWYIGHLEAGNQAAFTNLTAGPVISSSGVTAFRSTPPRPPTSILSLP